jgi:protein-S-isoprenylcysteine O-methyltransferase Ste14
MIRKRHYILILINWIEIQTGLLYDLADRENHRKEEGMNRFKQWQEQKTSPGRRVILLVIGALIFPTGIPAVLVLLLPRVDEKFGIASFFIGNANILFGVLMVVLGGGLALWTILAQVTLAAGTPFPMLPTQKLIIVGPFRYCRNPMTLGTLLAYTGVAVWVGSFSALLAVLVLALLLLAYLKGIEEQELELRFGEEYLEYKKNTPFILPRFNPGRSHPQAKPGR